MKKTITVVQVTGVNRWRLVWESGTASLYTYTLDAALHYAAALSS